MITLKQIAQSRAARAVLIALPILLLPYAAWLAVHREYVVFPGKNSTASKAGFVSSSGTALTASAYSDSSFDHGTSSITDFSVADTGISISFVLRNGFSHPYAGIAIAPKNGSGSLDVSSYDKVTITIDASSEKSVTMYLHTFQKGLTTPRNRLSVRVSQMRAIAITKNQPQTVTCDLKRFTTPDWDNALFRRNQVRSHTSEGADEFEINEPDFGKLTGILIENGPYPALNTTHSFVVKKISFFINLQSRILIILGVCFFYYALIFFAKRIFWSLSRPVVVSLEKINGSHYSDKEFERLADFMAKNYSKDSLNVSDAMAALGLNESAVEARFQKNLRMDFQRYLLLIRLSEVKRLLVESERTIADIAFNVGFRNLTTFNKAFLKEEQRTPTEFRKKRGRARSPSR